MVPSVLSICLSVSDHSFRLYLFFLSLLSMVMFIGRYVYISGFVFFLVHDCHLVLCVYFTKGIWLFSVLICMYCSFVFIYVIDAISVSTFRTYYFQRMALIGEVIACGQEVLLVNTSSLVIRFPDFLLSCGSPALNVPFLPACGMVALDKKQHVESWPSLWEIKKRKKLRNQYFPPKKGRKKKKQLTAWPIFLEHGSLTSVTKARQKKKKRDQ